MPFHFVLLNLLFLLICIFSYPVHTYFLTYQLLYNFLISNLICASVKHLTSNTCKHVSPSLFLLQPSLHCEINSFQLIRSKLLFLFFFFFWLHPTSANLLALLLKHTHNQTVSCPWHCYRHGPSQHLLFPQIISFTPSAWNSYKRIVSQLQLHSFVHNLW